MASEDGDDAPATFILRVLARVCADTLRAGPEKGMFRFIHPLCCIDAAVPLVSFRLGTDDPTATTFAAATRAMDIDTQFLTQRERNCTGRVRDVVHLVRREHIDILQWHCPRHPRICLLARPFARRIWGCFLHRMTTQILRVRSPVTTTMA